MRNEQVIDAWVRGDSAHTNNLSTDGTKLYSYNLMIGDRMDGQVRIWDYTASGHYYSQTTSCHIGLALRSAGNFILMDPGADAMIYDRSIGADRKWCGIRRRYV